MIRHAFTLAEVLITLGIIGVVAAMTLPSVINSTKNKQLEASFKKQYSQISKVLDYMYANDMCTTPDCLSSSNLFEVYNLMATVVKKCTPDNVDEKYCVSGTRDPSYKNFTRKISPVITDAIDDYQVILSDGALVTFNSWNGTVTIGVDVNGKDKLPNALGHDVFLFAVINKANRGIVIPYGAKGAPDEKTNCDYSGRDLAYNGLGCAVKALSDPDFFKKLP